MTKPFNAIHSDPGNLESPSRVRPTEPRGGVGLSGNRCDTVAEPTYGGFRSWGVPYYWGPYYKGLLPHFRNPNIAAIAVEHVPLTVTATRTRKPSPFQIGFVALNPALKTELSIHMLAQKAPCDDMQINHALS